MRAVTWLRLGSLRCAARLWLTDAGFGTTPIFRAKADPSTPESAAAAEMSVALIDGLTPLWAAEIRTMKSMNSPAKANTAP